MTKPVWTQQDYVIGRCSQAQVGHPTDMTHEAALESTAEPTIHPLVQGVDLDHPDADRIILRKLYHANPQAFLDAYGTAGINKLMELAARETAVPPYPEVTNAPAWAKLLKDVAGDVAKAGADTSATPAILLALLHRCKGSLAELGRGLTP